MIVEAFGICALVAWLADAPGPRSRRFAMWSAVIVFALSLVGQVSSHAAPAAERRSRRARPRYRVILA